MKLKQFIPAALMGILAVGFTSCDGKEEPKYTPAQATAADKISFEAAVQTVEIASDATEFPVMIYREANADAPAKRVSIVTTFPDVNGTALNEAFIVPQTVEFPAGEESVQIMVKVATAALEMNVPYNLTLGVDPNDGNSYLNTAATTIRVIKSSFSPWTEMGQGVWNLSILFSNPIAAPVRVMSRYDQLDDKVIEYEVQEQDENGEWVKMISMESQDKGATIQIPAQDFMWNSQYGEYIQIADLFTYDGNEQYKALTTYDAASKTFKIAVMYYISLGEFGYGIETIVLN